MARISTASAVLGPCVAVAVAVALAACSADDPAHRSFRPQEITASGIPYTGNGIAALDSQGIVTKTVKATSSAPTVHLTGTLTGVPVPADSASSTTGSEYDRNGALTSGVADSAAATPGAPGKFSMDMVFTQFGAVGDLTSGSATSRLLRIEDEVWTAEPSSFWKEIGAINSGKAYGGLYVRIPTADPRYAGFTDDTRIGYLLDRLLQTSTTWTKGKVGTVNGDNALELDGTGRNGHKASIWVATDGEPYILRIAPTSGSYHGQIDFTDYDDRVAIQAPLPGQVLGNALLVVPPSVGFTAPFSPTPVVAGLPTSPAASGTPTSTSPAPPVKPTVSASPSASSPTPSPSSSPTPSASSSPTADAPGHSSDPQHTG